mgnify:CR=1 FL=1
MTTSPISPELKTVLRRLKLSGMLDTLPERCTLARQQQMPHPDFLLLVLSDEATRRDGLATTLRAQRARLAGRTKGHRLARKAILTLGGLVDAGQNLDER